MLLNRSSFRKKNHSNQVKNKNSTNPFKLVFLAPLAPNNSETLRVIKIWLNNTAKNFHKDSNEKRIFKIGSKIKSWFFGRCPFLTPITLKRSKSHKIRWHILLTEFDQEYNAKRITKITWRIIILQWFLKNTHFPPFWPLLLNGRGHIPQNQYQASYRSYKHHIKIS